MIWCRGEMLILILSLRQFWSWSILLLTRSPHHQVFNIIQETMIKINRYIDHTLLKATATQKDIIQLCQEARDHKFFSVCVNSGWISLAKDELKGSQVQLCAVVGFPLGAMSTATKVFEARQAITDGASEIDMVISIGQLKSKNLEMVEQEIRAVREIIGDHILKVILETCYLSSDEIQVASQLAVKAQADFVKTSTGFGTAGADAENITLMRQAVDGKAKIKASGGIKNLDTALHYIELGVDRIGTSAGTAIVKELDQ